MGAGSVVPPDLEARGLDLALMALLHGLDPDVVANEDVPRVLAAIGRVNARRDALELAWVDGTARRDPSAPPGAVRRLARPHRFGADEVRVAAGWPRQRAERDVAFADEPRDLLPDVAAAWHDGEIDRAKAGICHTYLADLPAAERTTVWVAVAGKIAGWNTGRLAARLRKLTLAAAPDKAEERYERAVAARRAVWFLNPDGTASLALDGVAPGDAAAAKKRIAALARALRRTGCPGSLDQLRADITLALLDGTLDGLTSAQILARFRPTTGNEPTNSPPTRRMRTTRPTVRHRPHPRRPTRRQDPRYQPQPTMRPRPSTQTEGGWTLHQPEPGVLVWRSPLGQTYRTRADPLIDPPPELDPDPPF